MHLNRITTHDGNAIVEIGLFFLCVEKRPMTQHYETARSHGGASLILIFRAGGWETLPFEIRLLRPWYGSEFLERTGLTPRQQLDITRRGYSIAEAQPSEIEQPTRVHMRVRNQRGDRKTLTPSTGEPVRSARSIAPRLRSIAFG